MNLPKYFRPINRDGFDPVIPEENVGPKIRLAWIPIDKLFVDSRYQRPLNKGAKSNARQIARKFKWRRFAPIIVTPIEGTDCYCVIDGQYKSTGLALRGLADAPCAIVEAKTVEEQADSFKFLNANTTRIMEYDIFRARLVSQDPESTELNGIALDCGIHLRPSNTPQKTLVQGDCTTYKSFKASAKKFKKPIFTATMKILAKNKTSIGFINSTYISAFCQLLKTNPTWVDTPAICDFMEKINLAALDKEVRKERILQENPKSVIVIQMVREKVVAFLASQTKDITQ